MNKKDLFIIWLALILVLIAGYYYDKGSEQQIQWKNSEIQQLETYSKRDLNRIDRLQERILELQGQLDLKKKSKGKKLTISLGSGESSVSLPMVYSRPSSLEKDESLYGDKK